MPSKSVVVGSAVGLHARPAAIIAEAAEARHRGHHQRRRRQLVADDHDTGSRSGDSVEVAGEDQAAVDAIAALVVQDLDA